MRHADDHFLDAPGARLLQQVIEQRRERFAALAGEALLSDEAGVQVALEPLGGRHPFQDASAGIPGAYCGRPCTLSSRSWIQRFCGVSVMCMYSAPMRAAVGFLHGLDDVAQRQLIRTDERAGVERRVHVLGRQAVVRGIELRQVRLLRAPERIDVGVAHAEEAIGVDELEHRDLLALDRGQILLHLPRRRRPGASQGFERRDDGPVRDLSPADRLCESVEMPPPRGIDRVRVVQVLLVQLFDEGGVAAGQVRTADRVLKHGAPPCSLAYAVRRVDRPGTVVISSRLIRPAAAPRYRAGAGGRSCSPDPRSSRSTARSSPRCAPSRRSP